MENNLTFVQKLNNEDDSVKDQNKSEKYNKREVFRVSSGFICCVACVFCGLFFIVWDHFVHFKSKGKFCVHLHIIFLI